MTDVPSTRRCPACGVANHAGRELCGGCGSDLDDGTMPPQAPGGWAVARSGVAGTGVRGGRRHDDRGGIGAARWWWIVVAVVASAALVVAGLIALGVGPFAATPVVPEVSFDPEAYEEEPRLLPLTDIATRTTRGEFEGRPVDASMMVDDDPDTAWRSDGDPVGEGRPNETIDLRFSGPVWVSRLVLRNGDHRDAEAYADAARLQEVRLTLDGGVVVPVLLQDLGLQEQVIAFAEPVLTTAVRLEVRRVFSGGEFEDLAISDLHLEGWFATSEDGELAERRAEARPATGSPAS